MKKIVIQDNFAFLYFNSQFYTNEAILRTIEVYCDFVQTSLKQVGKYFVLKIEPKNNDYSLLQLCDEISNYLLSEEHKIKEGDK